MVRSSSRRAALACPALAVVLLASSLAFAGGVAPDDATPAQKKDAMAHFVTGKHAAESQNWEEAEAELRASLGIIDSPNARLVLSRALRDSGEYAKAWAEYGQTIADATKLGEKDERYKQTADAAKTERGELEAKLAFVTVTVDHAPADATLKVGGRVIPQEQWSAPIVVSPGAVDVVVADASGKELARKTVGASVGQKAPVALDTQPPAPTATAATTPSADDVPPKDKAGETDEATPEAPSSPGSRAKLRPVAYVAGGVGVAGFIVFGVFGAMEKSAYSSLQSACPGNVCPPDKASQISNGKTDELLANVGLGVGIAGLAVGATLFAISLGGSSSTAAPAAASTASASLVVSPSFIGLRGAL